MFAGNDAVLPSTETVIVRFAVVLPESEPEGEEGWRDARTVSRAGSGHCP